MISYSIYKIAHLVGVMMVYLSIGGVAMHVINGGTRENTWRKSAAITHGVGVLLVLVSGFGLLARIGVIHGSLPGWVLTKLAIWLIFSIMTGVLLRKKSWSKPIWIVTIVLGAAAAYLAGSKPF